LIGSWGSSDAGLRRVAKYGDGWKASAYNITPDKFKTKFGNIIQKSTMIISKGRGKKKSMIREGVNADPMDEKF
jgi:hypothetical protein